MANKIDLATQTKGNLPLSEMPKASTNDVLVGSGASGSGAAYTEIALGTNLTISGTTLNAALGTGNQLNLTYTNTSISGSTVGVVSVQQSTLSDTNQGSGWTLGNAGGWSVGKQEYAELDISQRGIAQLKSGVLNKHAVGDTAGIYYYVNADGGLSAQSDEGVVGANFQSLENIGYFKASILSTTGTGDQAPTYHTLTGANHTTDGSFMLDISKGTLSGNMSSASVALSLTTGAGSVSTFLNYLPTTATLPVSTAIGIATAAITNPQVTADSPALVTVAVTLCQISSSFPAFTAGSVVTVAGHDYPEQSIIQTASSVVSGVQTLTLKLRNPNTQAILFQGGIQGQFISFDANLSFSGMRSAYYAFGSLTGSDLIYGVNIGGGLATHTLPITGNEAAVADGGSSSGFHLYPGAEVVKNTDQGYACTLEQNGVAWANSDLVENPHYPIWGGAGLGVIRQQETPSSSSEGMVGIYLNIDGHGFGGANVAAMRLRSDNPSNYYQADGGPLLAPGGIELFGFYHNGLYMTNSPQGNGACVYVQSPNASGSTAAVGIVIVDYHVGGNLYFRPATGDWRFDGPVDAPGFSQNGTAGATGTATLAKLTPGGTNGSLTIVGGLITAIVNPT